MPNLPGRFPPWKPLQKMIDQLNQLRDYVASLKPSLSYNTLTSHTGVGVRRQSLGTEGSAPSPGMVFRGEWRPDVSDYLAGNVVVVRGGVSAGTYIALLDVPAGNAPAFPDVGVYWASIARNYAGQWA